MIRLWMVALVVAVLAGCQTAGPAKTNEQTMAELPSGCNYRAKFPGYAIKKEIKPPKSQSALGVSLEYIQPNKYYHLNCVCDKTIDYSKYDEIDIVPWIVHELEMRKANHKTITYAKNNNVHEVHASFLMDFDGREAYARMVSFYSGHCSSTFLAGGTGYDYKSADWFLGTITQVAN